MLHSASFSLGAPTPKLLAYVGVDNFTVEKEHSGRDPDLRVNMRVFRDVPEIQAWTPAEIKQDRDERALRPDQEMSNPRLIQTLYI